MGFSTILQTGKIAMENFTEPGSVIAKNEHSVSKVIFVSVNPPNTEKEVLFLKELLKTYDVEFANEKEAREYAKTDEKNTLIFIAPGNSQNFLESIAKEFSKAPRTPEPGEYSKLLGKGTAFMFKETVNILSKKLLIKKQSVKITLCGMKVMPGNAISEFVQASNIGPLFNDTLRA